MRGKPISLPQPTERLDQLHRAAVLRLRAAGKASPELDARLLIADAIKRIEGVMLAHEDYILHPERMVGEAARRDIESLLMRRIAGEPVSRILGVREFYGRDFQISPAVLDPRPDTETLVTAVLDYLNAAEIEAPRILDIGTGSGAILLTLLAERPDASGIGTDASPEALAIAQKNARHMGLHHRAEFQLVDWAGEARELFHIIVSNPPYILASEIDGLDLEVRGHDPRLALDGGSDGLAAYQQIIPQVVDLLDDRGLIALEVGEGQAEAVLKIFENIDNASKLSLSTRLDLARIERCVLAAGCDVFSHHPHELMKR